jgi:hypothetical protein
MENKLNTWMLWVIEEKTDEFYVKKIILNIKSYKLILHCQQYFKEKVIVVNNISIV